MKGNKMRPGEIIGYRKNGMPIRLQAGGSEPLPPQQQAPIPQPAPQSVPPVQPQYFTADQLEAARQQEKDKVYGRLTKAEQQAETFKTELDALKARQEAYDAKVAKEQADADEARRKAEEDKMSAAELIAAKEQELIARQQAFEANMLAKQALLEKEQQFLTLRDFTSRRINEEMAQDNIAPEFLDYINGNTEEEIEASITKAKEKTASIVSQVNGGQTRLPGVSPTGFSPTGPLEQFTGQQQEPTLAQLQAMSMDEYAAYRRTAGIDRAGKDRGMFG